MYANEKQVLLLNFDYTPLKVLSWQKAVSLWFTDKVEIVEEYNDFSLRSVSITIKCPAVVRLLKYVRRKQDRMKFSRLNVFSRDNFTCQYCGLQPGTPELTYDHVVPKSQGGKTTWENIATSCVPCNARKGNRTPEEASMKLKSRPRRPEKNEFVFRVNIPRSPTEWRDWLYWNQKLDNDEGD